MNNVMRQFNGLRPLLRGLPFIVLCLVATYFMLSKYISYMVPHYEASAKIRLADVREGNTSSNLYKDFDVFVNSNKVGAEIEMLKSQVILEKVIQKIPLQIRTWRVGTLKKSELYEDNPFTIASTFVDKKMTSPFDLYVHEDSTYALHVREGAVFNGKLGKIMMVENDSFLLQLNKKTLAEKPNIQVADHYQIAFEDKEKLINDLRNEIDIAAVDKDLPIIKITYKNPMKHKVVDVVNTLAETYIQDYIEYKINAATTTSKFLDTQIDKVGSKLTNAENNIEHYKEANEIVNITQETETNLRKIASMKIQQTNVKMTVDALNDLNNYVNSGKDITQMAPNFEAYTDLLATELIKKMKQYQGEKRDLLVRYTPNNELVKNVDLKIQELGDYLKEGIRNSKNDAEAKLQRITRDIDEAESDFDGLATKEKNMGILQRNFMLNEQTYNFLTTKKMEAELVRAAGISFHRIISKGTLPQHTASPSKPLILSLGLFLAFLLSVLLVYLANALFAKVNDEEIVERNSDIGIATAIPYLDNATTNKFFDTQSLTLQIKGMLKPHDIIGINSMNRGEGKSFVSKQLALSLAKQNKKVFVFDAVGEIGKIDHPNVVYRNYANQENWYSNIEELNQFMESWRQHFDYTILCNQPQTVANSHIMTSKADVNFVLLDATKTPKSTVEKVNLWKHEYGIQRCFFMLNRQGSRPSLWSKWMKKTNETKPNVDEYVPQYA